MQPQPTNTPAPLPVAGEPQPTTLPAVTAPQAASPVAAPASAAPASSSAPAMADDGDLIEKEWVAKVKQIVTATAHDPYEQNLQFTKLKADYMQKRYGKVMKSEDLK